MLLNRKLHLFSITQNIMVKGFKRKIEETQAVSSFVCVSVKTMFIL